MLGFNLGIEAFQLLVILAAMPWLVLLARSHVYGPLRIAGAALTGIAAAAWFAERALGWSNPIGPFVETVATHALWLLAGLVVLAVAAKLHGALKPSGGHHAGSVQPLRYSRRMKESASGVPGAESLAGSQSSFLPAR